MTISYGIALSYLYLALGAFLFLLGLTIFRTGGASPVSRSTALILFFCGIGPILTSSNFLLTGSMKKGVLLYTSLFENFEYLWEFYFPSLLLFALSFPRESRLVSKYGFVAVLIFCPHIVHLVTLVLVGGSGSGIGEFLGRFALGERLPIDRGNSILAGVSDLFSIFLSLLIKAHRELFSFVNVGFALLATGLLVRNSRRILGPRSRRWVDMVIVGLLVSTAVYVFSRVQALLADDAAAGERELAMVNVALVAGGGTIAYAVLRQQFLGIRFVLRKAVVYGVAALLFALVYLVVVKPVSAFFASYSVRGPEVFETGFVILAIIAFQPVLGRFEESLEKLLLRGRHDTRELLKTLGGALMSATSMGELEETLRAGLDRILSVTEVELRLFGEGEREGPTAALLGRIRDPVGAGELPKILDGASPGAARKFPGFTRRRIADVATGEVLRSLRSLARNADLVIPLVQGGSCRGVLLLGGKRYGLRYSSDELSFLSLLSGEILMALEKIDLLKESIEKRVLEEELKLARSIQARLLPTAFPHLRGYDFHALTVPSRYVAGDFYDFSLGEEGRHLFVAMADVSGKGAPASLLVATLHAALRSNHDVVLEPRSMLARLNRLLYESTEEDQFATLFYGVVDLEKGSMCFANAGHEFPILLADNGEARVLDMGGIVLGCVPEYGYDEYECTIPRGGALVLYTDGVTEAHSGDGFFGRERLKELLVRTTHRSAHELCTAVLAEVSRFRGAEAQDDLTLMVLQRKGHER